MANELKSKYSKNKLIRILNEDILKLNLNKIIKKKSIIFGNLPYNISSQILVKILRLRNFSIKIDSLILMFQKELGEKIIAEFPSTNYGRLSILTSYKLELKKSFMSLQIVFYQNLK